MVLSDGLLSSSLLSSPLRSSPLIFSLLLSSSVHKFPFSLLNEAKRDNSGAKIERVGNVTEILDKSIGRSVIRIKGAVSANNFIDFSSLQLEGNHLCLQICLLKATVATLHLELTTTRDISLRVTISTLYDQPRFLGRSLRLPLPARVGWTNLVIDLNEMLSANCPKNFGILKCVKVPTATLSPASGLTLLFLCLSLSPSLLSLSPEGSSVFQYGYQRLCDKQHCLWAVFSRKEISSLSSLPLTASFGSHRSRS
jgi:hypothetical protein